MNKVRKVTVAEKKVLKLENEIRKQKEKLGRLRNKVPLQEISDYELKNSKGKSVKLSQLFGKKDELLLIHNMGTDCPYCTMWADGFNGVLNHLKNRAAFVVESPNSPAVQKKFAASRGWKFEMVSSQESEFRTDLGFTSNSGDMAPGVSTFKKKNGKIYLASQSMFGPGDNYCSVWDLFDLLPSGASDWEAKFKY
jgi:predicted dithiol-disulfide oxidoreductase (DUF899 family)